MSQPFDYLSTGNTGQTFGNEEVPQVVDEAIEQQRLEIAQLLPNVQAILDTIDGEVAAVSDIRAYIKTLGTRPVATEIKAEYAARELFIAMCERMKVNITNRLADVEQQL